MRPRVEKKHLLLFNCGDYTIILAVGFTPDRELYDAMQETGELYAIGDCNGKSLLAHTAYRSRGGRQPHAGRPGRDAL